MNDHGVIKELIRRFFVAFDEATTAQRLLEGLNKRLQRFRDNTVQPWSALWQRYKGFTIFSTVGNPLLFFLNGDIVMGDTLNKAPQVKKFFGFGVPAHPVYPQDVQRDLKLIIKATNDAKKINIGSQLERMTVRAVEALARVKSYERQLVSELGTYERFVIVFRGKMVYTMCSNGVDLKIIDQKAGILESEDWLEKNCPKRSKPIIKSGKETK